MKITITKLSNIAAYAAIIIFSTLYSCTEPKDIGIDVQPPGDMFNVLYTDTVKIIAFSKAEDSVITDETLYNLLGNYIDPVFGKVSASFYTQLRLSGSIDFGTNAVCDSIIFTLVYKGYYGDSASLMTVRVHELYESIYLDSSYHSKRNIPSNGINLAQNISYLPRLSDSININGNKLAPHMRVKLKNSFGNQLINAGAANLQNNASFTQYLKGLYVTTNPVGNKGGICYFDLAASLSQITLYYHNDANDSLFFNFIIDQNCARFNTFNHYNFADAANPLKQQLAGNISVGDSLLFIQAMGGTRLKIKFPNLTSLNSINQIAVNNAELVFKIDENDVTTSSFPVPPKLIIVREMVDGTNAFLPDYSEGEDYHGGAYNATTKEYKFRITRYLQGLLNGVYPYDIGLNVMVSGSSIRSNRVVLSGPGRTNNRTKLILTYTKLQ